MQRPGAQPPRQTDMGLLPLVTVRWLRQTMPRPGGNRQKQQVFRPRRSVILPLPAGGLPLRGGYLRVTRMSGLLPVTTLLLLGDMRLNEA